MPDIPDALENQLPLVEEVRRALYPDMEDRPLNDRRKAFEITKHVAWRLRQHGIGLVTAKPGSENNVDGYTNDVVALKNGAHWDVLVGGEAGAFPSWGLVEEEHWPAIVPRWAPPINMDGPIPIPGPPVPTPGPTPAPNTELEKRVAALERRLERLETAGLTIAQVYRP